MHPILLKPFGFAIHSYGFMLMVGFILAIYVTTKRARLAGIKPEFITDMAIWAIIVGVIGARAAYILEWKPLEEQKMFDGGWRVFDVTDGNMSWLGVLAGLALAAGVTLLHNRFSRKKIVLRDKAGIRRSTVIAIAAIAILAALICARAWALGFWKYETEANGETVIHRLHQQYNLKYFDIRAGGITFFGGFLPAATVVILLTLRRGYNVLKTTDIIMPSVMLGLSFGRIGCFLNGCCWGTICEHGFLSNLAVRFPKLEEGGKLIGSLPFDSHLNNHLVERLVGEQTSLPVVPTQILESFFAFGLFLFLSWYLSRKRRHGEVMALCFALYAAGRFVLEFWRADNKTDWFGLTFSQNISVAVFALAAGFFLFLRLKKEQASPEQASPEQASPERQMSDAG